MFGLYDLFDLKRGIERNSFFHPKTGVPYPEDHPRYQQALKSLMEVDQMIADVRERYRLEREEKERTRKREFWECL